MAWRAVKWRAGAGRARHGEELLPCWPLDGEHGAAVVWAPASEMLGGACLAPSFGAVECERQCCFFSVERAFVSAVSAGGPLRVEDAPEGLCMFV